MNKVVDKGIKIDLHIHSYYSKGKDADKVMDNTIENIPVLVNGLVEQQVEMCAITDHDTFNYAIYEKLKKEEEKGNCIKKVQALPVTFGWPQLVTALIGGAVALLVVPVLRKALHK